MIKLSDYVMRFIAGRGIGHVFFLPGGGCMHLVDSLGRCADLEPICCLHEQASAIAAEAHGQYTNNPGVCLVTTGPGGTNAVTGVAGAWIDSTPMIVISGQVKRSDLIGTSGVRQMGVQEVDIVSIVRGITKYAVTLMEPLDVRYELEKAAHLAKEGRPGPVWIDIPLDVQGAMIEERALRGFAADERAPALPRDVIGRVIDLLNASSRPVLFAGNGIRLSGAVREFLELADALRVPVLTTWKTMDFLAEGHDLYCGRPGSIGQRGANFALQNSDLLIAIGARLDLAQVGFSYGNLARGARRVIVDIDPAEIAKLKMDIEVPVCVDAGVFIRSLLERRSAIAPVDPGWLARCREWKERYPVILQEYREDGDFVNTYMLVEVLSDLLDPSDVIIPGSSGSCSEITSQAFQVKEGQRIFNTPGLGSMGFGLPASIGACLASGRKRTISIIGDGGLQHNIQELETLARLRLPVKVLVLNNRGYASIRAAQRSHFKGRLVGCDATCGLTLPDTCKIAGAYGLPTERISRNGEVREMLDKVLRSDGPLVCEVMVDPDLITAPRLSSSLRPDGTIVSKPLEDLWPFLEREELQRNMIVPLPEE